MTLSDFIDDVREREKTLTVFTADDDEQLFDELVDFFEVQNITVRRGEVEPGGPQNFVVLHQEEEAVAVSTLEDVRDSLFVGSESTRFPGDVSLTDGDTPDVIEKLGNTTFSAEADGPFLITQIAHYIEDRAWRMGGGALHAEFGRLSALRNDPASLGVYRKLPTAGVDVHVYGNPDVELSLPSDVVVHTEGVDELADVRFVVFDGDGDDTEKAAMVAAESRDDSYRGFWTFDAHLVDEIIEYVERTFPSPK